jgi:hypothetical protein
VWWEICSWLFEPRCHESAAAQSKSAAITHLARHTGGGTHRYNDVQRLSSGVVSETSKLDARAPRHVGPSKSL